MRLLPLALLLLAGCSTEQHGRPSLLPDTTAQWAADIARRWDADERTAYGQMEAAYGRFITSLDDADDLSAQPDSVVHDVLQQRLKMGDSAGARGTYAGWVEGASTYTLDELRRETIDVPGGLRDSLNRLAARLGVGERGRLIQQFQGVHEADQFAGEPVYLAVYWERIGGRPASREGDAPDVVTGLVLLGEADGRVRPLYRVECTIYPCGTYAGVAHPPFGPVLVAGLDWMGRGGPHESRLVVREGGTWSGLTLSDAAEDSLIEPPGWEFTWPLPYLELDRMRYVEQVRSTINRYVSGCLEVPLRRRGRMIEPAAAAVLTDCEG